MSEAKSESHPTISATRDTQGSDIQREDLRLDCLRLAAQRQGARDSRGLLEIAEEYYGWVTAECTKKLTSASVPQVAPGIIDWPSVNSAPASRASTRLSLGVRASSTGAKGKRNPKRTRYVLSD